MTGRVRLTPEAEQQLNDLDDWIAEKSTAAIARRFVSAVLDHVEGIASFPLAGRARDDIRSGMRTTTFKKRTLIAYVVDRSSGDPVITVLGLFHGGQDWEETLGSQPEDDLS